MGDFGVFLPSLSYIHIYKFRNVQNWIFFLSVLTVLLYFSATFHGAMFLPPPIKMGEEGCRVSNKVS